MSFVLVDALRADVFRDTGFFATGLVRLVVLRVFLAVVARDVERAFVVFVDFFCTIIHPL